jgi:hypothetical protein
MVEDSDPHGFSSFLEAGSALNWKTPDPNPHQSQNSGALDRGLKWSHGGLWSVDAHSGGVEVQNSAVEGMVANGRWFASLCWGSKSSQIRIRLKGKVVSKSPSKWKVGSGPHQSECAGPDPDPHQGDAYPQQCLLQFSVL